MTTEITALSGFVRGFSFQCRPLSISHFSVLAHGATTDDLTAHNKAAVSPYKYPVVQGSLLASLCFKFHQEAVQISKIQPVLLFSEDRFSSVTFVDVPIFTQLEIVQVSGKTNPVVKWAITVEQEKRGSIATTYKGSRTMKYFPIP